MSLFRSTTAPCPNCGQPTTFEVCGSVNADRHPELRAAILDRTFQRVTCSHCQDNFQIAPRLSYLDVARGQWFAVFPLQQVDGWAAAEAEAQATFNLALGPDAGAAASEIGRGLQPRLVFGWRALREALIAQDAGLDPTRLELLKLLLIRGMDDPPLPLDAVLRLTGVDPASDDLQFEVLDRSDRTLEEMGVPRDLLDEPDRDPEGWAALRADLSVGLFRDMQRLTRGD
jgi:hypothetical protein